MTRPMHLSFLAAAAAAHDPNRQVFFGNFHVHTSYSFDVFANGAVTEPDAAYRWATEEPIAAGGGLDATIRIKRPLDWYAVSDHAEYPGIMPKLAEPGNPLGAMPVAKLLTSSDPAEGFKPTFPKWHADRREGRLIRRADQAFCGH